MGNLPRILEAIWLVLAFICLGMAIHATIQVGFNKSYMFFILSVVAFLMHLVRRFRRKAMDSKQNS